MLFRWTLLPYEATRYGDELFKGRLSWWVLAPHKRLFLAIRIRSRKLEISINRETPQELSQITRLMACTVSDIHYQPVPNNLSRSRNSRAVPLLVGDSWYGKIGSKLPQVWGKPPHMLLRGGPGGGRSPWYLYPSIITDRQTTLSDELL